MKISKEHTLALLCEETDMPSVTPAMHLADDIGITSFQMLSFVTRLNAACGVSVGISDILAWERVEDIIKTVEEYTK